MSTQPLDLDAIQARYETYATLHESGETFMACPSKDSADDVPALLARVRDLEADLRRERAAHSSTIDERDRATDYAAEQQPAGPALTGWAADMADASLTPYDGALTLDADDAPFVRLHFAFADDMPDADRARFLTQLGQVILAKL